MNITDAIFDSELGCTAFTVERITYTRTRPGSAPSIVAAPHSGDGSFQVTSHSVDISATGGHGMFARSRTAQALGCIHPGTPEMLQLLPEEEKAEEFIAIYTDYALSTGTPEDAGASFTAPDRIHWNNQTWRVVRVRDWQMFGYYQAYAVLMQE